MKKTLRLFLAASVLLALLVGSFACAEENSAQSSQAQQSAFEMGTAFGSEKFSISFSQVHISKPLRTDDGKVMEYSECGDKSYFLYYSGTITNNTDEPIYYPSLFGKIVLNGTEERSTKIASLSEFGYLDTSNRYSPSDHVSPNSTEPFVVYTTVQDSLIPLIHTVSVELGFNEDLSKVDTLDNCQYIYTNETSSEQIIMPNFSFDSMEIDQPIYAAELEITPKSFVISDDAKIGNTTWVSSWDKMVLALHCTVRSERTTTVKNPRFAGEVIVNDQYRYDLKGGTANLDIKAGETCDGIFYAEIPVDVSNIVEKAVFRICFDNDLNSHCMYATNEFEFENQYEITWETTPRLAAKPTDGAEEEEAPVFSYETLQRGDKNDSVCQMQSYLIKLGYLNGTADGDFGKGTEKALRAFQADEGLEETGIADETTLRTLYSKEVPETPDVTISVRKVKEQYGGTDVYAQLTNNSTRPIDRIDFLVICYDVYGEIIEPFGMYERTACNYMEKVLNPGKTTPSNWRWSIYNATGTTKVEVAVAKYHFKDAETVEIPEDEFIWVTYEK